MPPKRGTASGRTTHAAVHTQVRESDGEIRALYEETTAPAPPPTEDTVLRSQGLFSVELHETIKTKKSGIGKATLQAASDALLPLTAHRPLGEPT